MTDVEERIDRRLEANHALSRYGRLVSRKWWIVAIAGMLGAIAGLLLSLASTPQYQASATLYVTSGSDADTQSAYQGSLASQQRVASYGALVRSDAVVRAALEESDLSISLEDAKRSLSAATAPDTVLLTVTAQSDSPVDATRLVNGVASALSSYVSELEVPAEGGVPLARLTVVTWGFPVGSPVSPSVELNVLLGLGVGTLASVFALIVWLRVADKIVDATELEALLKSSVLAAVPADARLRPPSVIDFGAGTDIVAEEYRRLRANLAFANVDDPARRILVTSANAGEGKTTTAINLAGALADFGERVVLVDADLRRPSVARRLDLNADVGLSDYLRSASRIDELVQAGPNGIDVIACGQVPPNPSELLGSQRMRAGFVELLNTYDFVIVDSAPLLPVADTSVLSQWTDGALLVVKSAGTTVSAVVSAREQLAAARVPVLGALLNCVAGARRIYGYGYGADR